MNLFAPISKISNPCTDTPEVFAFPTSDLYTKNDFNVLFEKFPRITQAIDECPALSDSEMTEFAYLASMDSLAEDWNSPEDDIWDEA